MSKEKKPTAVKPTDLQHIKLADIRDNPVALRSVNRTTEEYQGLVASIGEIGLMNAITVRRRTDPETKAEYYELVDGLQRKSASQDAGLETIPAQITEFDDDQVLEAQIIANIHRVETKHHEYSQQLKRIMIRNPLMTEADLAKKVSRSTTWIQKRLGLVKILNTEIQALINEGKIGLANAYALSKLPPEEMADFVQMALTLSPDLFVPKVDERAKEIKEAKRKGEAAAPREFTPVAHTRKVKEIKEEAGLVDGVVGGAVAKQLVADLKIETAAEGFMMGVLWTMNMDPKSIEVQKADDEQRRAERDAAKKRKKAESAAKKAADQAAKNAAAADEAEKAMGALTDEEKKAVTETVAKERAEKAEADAAKAAAKAAGDAAEEPADADATAAK